jgi:hypothetical protein
MQPALINKLWTKNMWQKRGHWTTKEMMERSYKKVGIGRCLILGLKKKMYRYPKSDVYQKLAEYSGNSSPTNSHNHL